MSLDCWTCPILQRTNSNADIDFGKENCISKFCCVQISRSLSGNLSPPVYEQIGTMMRNTGIPPKKIKKGPRRFHTFNNTTYGAMGFEANVKSEPRLARSSGMRRDWSFEEAKGLKRGGKVS
ncbi:Detected protein of unknown function [Hibiscus syriacus]|uniref:Uncharacterized protein n=1 Tax=Hibiscus syriacus TaxID=106335 RepID=A0A6A3CMG7_HIBSY|nr:uncharacterized protein LOC120194339 [Hibiscus syriacus]KAE8728408.1 Detected protein of unknown function [Hibiscus syriacus]